MNICVKLIGNDNYIVKDRFSNIIVVVHSSFKTLVLKFQKGIEITVNIIICYW